jgi:hypothetical protein
VFAGDLDGSAAHADLSQPGKFSLGLRSRRRLRDHDRGEPRASPAAPHAGLGVVAHGSYFFQTVGELCLRPWGSRR